MFWRISDMWHWLSKCQFFLSASLSSGWRQLLQVNPQPATSMVPLLLHSVCSLLAALNETKCCSSNYLFTSGVKIKPADRESLEVCKLSYSLFTLLRDFQLLQVHKFLSVDQGRDCKLTWIIGVHLCTFQRFKSLPWKKSHSSSVACFLLIGCPTGYSWRWGLKGTQGNPNQICTISAQGLQDQLPTRCRDV